MNFTTRSLQKELLDNDNIPFEDIKQNMEELNLINTRLGGHGITIKGLKELLGNRQQVVVCEIGCGGGDNLLALKKWCEKRKVSIRFIGIDIKSACIDFARTRNGLAGNTSWIISDYKKVSFDQKPDVIFSSLFCHHFTNEELQVQLKWMVENSNAGFFINDLHRHPLAYFSIKILTRIFSSSYLVKNDAPLSVARGFKRKEWETIFTNAGLTKYQICWKWAFRHLIIVKK